MSEPIKTTAEYVRKFYIHILDYKEEFSFEVSSRDINQILKERPELAKIFHTLLLFILYERISAKIDVDGNLICVSSDTPVNISPRFFIPDQGKIYTMEELRDRLDEKSEKAKRQMEVLNLKACFIDNSDKVFAIARVEEGDRILDKSEVTAIDWNKNDPNPNTESLIEKEDQIDDKGPGDDPIN